MLQKYTYDVQASHQVYLQELQQKGLASIKENVLYLTDKGKLLADQITLDLMVE